MVICGATSGYQLDFDVRYLWMRQKEIIGSHFANAWEATKANQLIEESKVRPVLWQTMGFEKVAEAHQLLRDNRHLGKIAILVGATEEGQGKTAEGPGAIRAEVGALMAGVIHIDWYATVLRQESFAAEVAAVAPLALRYGATQYSVHRSRDDRYKITQMAWFESKQDWYSYWEGLEMIEFRRRHIGPLPDPDHLRVVRRAGRPARSVPRCRSGAEPEPAPAAPAPNAVA